jgi:hypothetical protein
VTSSSHPVRAAPSTVELPLTPEMMSCVHRSSSSWRLLLALLFGGALIVATVLSRVQQRRVVTGLAIVTVALVLVGTYIWRRIAAYVELRDGLFLRTTGPLTVERKTARKLRGADEVSYGPLKFFDRELWPDESLRRRLCEARVLSGVVDHAPHLDAVFEIRDDAGRVVYRDPNLMAAATPESFTKTSGADPGVRIAERTGTGHWRRPRLPRFGWRSMELVRLLDAFLIFAVLAVLGNRVFLEITGYPKVQTGKLHIAHVLWGGLMMMIAIVFATAFVAPATRRVVAVLGESVSASSSTSSVSSSPRPPIISSNQRSRSSTQCS